MLRNFVVIALRNLMKNKLFSLINIGGLALGLTVFLFTNILANYEREYDSFFEKSDRIFMPTIHFAPGWSANMRTAPFVPTAMGPLMGEFPGVEQVARGLERPFIARIDDRKFQQKIRFVDEGFFEIFDLEFVAGDPNTMLGTPNSLIISDRMAEKYFGEADPLHKIITVDGQHDMQVSGIFQSLPENSHFRNSWVVESPLDMIASMEAISQLNGEDKIGNWEEIDPKNMTYVLLKEGVAPADLNNSLEELRLAHMPEELRELISKFTLIHVSRFNTYIEDAMGIPVYGVIQAIGLLILIMAIFNYTNLTTAQAMTRSREVGIRKVLGADRKSLFVQFTMESFILTFIAAFLSIAILEFVLPFLNDIIHRNVRFDIFGNPGAATFYFGTIFLTGLLSAAYPSTVLARMNISQVLSASMRFGKATVWLRNLMLGVQFTFAIVLTTIVFIISAQSNMVKEATNSFDRQHIVNLFDVRPEMLSSYDVLINELNAISSVIAASGESIVPFEGTQFLLDMATTRQPEDRVQTNFYFVDEHFMDVFEVPLLEGRSLMRSRRDLVEEWDEGDDAPATINILINEMAVQQFGWVSPQEAIGKHIFQMSSSPDSTAYTIVGVVEDRDLIGPSGRLAPAVFELRPGFFSRVSIRIANGEVSETLSSIEEVWNRVYPAYPLVQNSLEEQVTKSFSLFNNISLALTGLAIIAIILAGLGLFGLTVFMTEKRTKEIGLRKVFGASIPVIVRLLLWQFLKPVMVAIVFGLPLAWWLAQFYLEFFGNRVTLTAAIFIGAAVLNLGIAWVTVAIHAVQAALPNPIHALRYE